MSDTGSPSIDMRLAEEERVNRLQNEARERKWPNIRPVDAATLIIVDRSATTPKVLMGRRNASVRFMPNKFVFPGGRIDPADRSIPVAGVLEEHVEKRLMAGTPVITASRARALALTCIRETFEETGLMLGTKEFGAPEIAANSPWQAFGEHGVMPVLEDMRFIARAITPPKRPKRFDTRFFTIDSRAIVHHVEGIIGPEAELVELCWVSIDEAMKLDLPAITQVVLDELGSRLNVIDDRYMPVPFYFERYGKFLREEV